MKHKRVVTVDIRTGQPRISILRADGDNPPGIRRDYTATLNSFDRVVKVCTAHPHFGFHPDGFDRWISIER